VALVLLYLVVLVLVAIVLFGAASLLFGRGEQLPPLPRGTTATVLPAFGVTGSDVDAVKFTQVLRGYKASEVDWVLDRLARELEALRGQLAAVHAASAAKAAKASQASRASDAEAAEAEADGLELPDGPDAGDHRDAT
jgi:DivIVA domain-containing protein